MKIEKLDKSKFYTLQDSQAEAMSDILVSYEGRDIRQAERLEIIERLAPLASTIEEFYLMIFNMGLSIEAIGKKTYLLEKE